MKAQFEAGSVFVGPRRRALLPEVPSLTVSLYGRTPAILLFVLVVGALPTGLLPTLLAAALLFGWTQIGGLCGAAHVNTMSALRRMSPGLWLRAVLAYSVCGAISAMAVGVALGAIGKLTGSGIYRWWGVAGVAAILALREVDILRFRLVEKRCQTERVWAYQFGWTQAAGLWGFHIGLGFATVITYGGFWALVAAILALGNPVLGAEIMACYWVGRILPLWFTRWVPFGPLLAAENTYPLFRGVNAGGLVAIGLVIVIMIAR